MAWLRAGETFKAGSIRPAIRARLTVTPSPGRNASSQMRTARGSPWYVKRPDVLNDLPRSCFSTICWVVITTRALSSSALPMALCLSLLVRTHSISCVMPPSSTNRSTSDRRDTQMRTPTSSWPRDARRASMKCTRACDLPTPGSSNDRKNLGLAVPFAIASSVRARSARAAH